MAVCLEMCLLRTEVTNIATVNFINYQKQCWATLKGVIGYVCQKKKTGIDRENLEMKHQVRTGNQQCEIKLISGLNCTPETAYAEFISTKASYHKSDGLQFYHYTQSFKDGENISPKVAHEIAMKFAKEHYNDYEVLIATHIDNDHLHTHFIINSVSFETGKKLHQPPNPYSGLIFCADCGKILNLHRAHTMAESKNNFMCSTYKRYGKKECSSHYLRQTILDKIILDDIKRVTHFARQDEALFIKHINEKNTVETRATINKLQKELDSMAKRDVELTVLFKRLYEDNVLGRIPDEHYRTLSEEYTSEQKFLRLGIPKAKEDIEKLKNSLTNVDRFIEKAKKYTDLTELTPEILHLFIEKIVVGEKAEKYSRTTPQDIWIYYRDIGMLSDVKKEFDIEPIEELFEICCEVDADEIIKHHDMLLAM